jgi:hypothetical protein
MIDNYIQETDQIKKIINKKQKLDFEKNVKMKSNSSSR